MNDRLRMAARLCAGAKRVIDVGCDHAQLCIHLITRCGVGHAFASDVREGPLEMARRAIAAHGLEDKITPVLCDGLSAFSPDDADTVAICGMGGENIADILARAPWTGDGRHTLVLQPMSRDRQLRLFLMDNGYTIAEERLVEEKNHLYVVMKVRAGAYRGGRHGLFSDAMEDDPGFGRYLARLEQGFLAVTRSVSAAGGTHEEQETLLAEVREARARLGRG